MIHTEKTIWESCSEEEYEQNHRSFNYRRVPVYNNIQAGILEQIKLMDKEPDGWRYEKAVGKKLVLILSEKEAKDENLVSLLMDMTDKMIKVCEKCF